MKISYKKTRVLYTGQMSIALVKENRSVMGARDEVGDKHDAGGNTIFVKYT